MISKNKKKIQQINNSFDLQKRHNLDADGSWDEHNCYVEKCEFCNEEPCICEGDIS
jgi:hypothetical protein